MQYYYILKDNLSIFFRSIVYNECKLFTEPNKSKILFRFDKIDVSDIKKFMGFINGIIHDYGLVLKNKKKFKQIKINNTWKTKSINNYIFCYDKNINLYL